MIYARIPAQETLTAIINLHDLCNVVRTSMYVIKLPSQTPSPPHVGTQERSAPNMHDKYIGHGRDDPDLRLTDDVDGADEMEATNLMDRRLEGLVHFLLTTKSPFHPLRNPSIHIHHYAVTNDSKGACYGRGRPSEVEFTLGKPSMIGDISMMCSRSSSLSKILSSNLLKQYSKGHSEMSIWKLHVACACLYWQVCHKFHNQKVF